MFTINDIFYILILNLSSDFVSTITIKKEKNLEIRIVTSCELLDLMQIFPEKQDSAHSFSYKISLI